MDLVVSDASPLRYLIEIDEIEILKVLFDAVLVPAAVVSELQNPSTPEKVVRWLASPPRWIVVTRVVPGPDLETVTLDPGERAAIQLAISAGINLVAIDERRGSRVAARKGLATIGTLGILERAAIRGLLDFEEAIERLLQTNFRCSLRLIEVLIDEHRRRPS